MNKWKRTAIFLAALMILSSLTVYAPAELAGEEGGEGEVLVLEHTEEEILPALELKPAEPFNPDPETEPELPEEPEERTVFDMDNRVTVKNTGEYPYSAIAYMVVKGKCGCGWTGSGFMVDRNKLLTAAHCLVCSKHSEWAKSITFYFGFRNKSSYRYKYNGKWTAYAGNLFRDREYSVDWDYGCVKLYKNVGDKVGWLGSYWGMSDSQIANQFLYVAGYRDGVLKYDYGFADAKSSQHIKYRMDTQPGNSGGPVFTRDYYAIGINIAENDSHNTGYRLTTTVKGDLDGL